MTGGKGLSIFLAVLFGLSGLAILVLTWTRPMGGAERVMSTFIGAAGALMPVVKVRRSRPAKDKVEESLVKVEVPAKR